MKILRKGEGACPVDCTELKLLGYIFSVSAAVYAQYSLFVAMKGYELLLRLVVHVIWLLSLFQSKR